MNPSIAIVGMACCYADTRSPGELWENVLAQRRAFRRLPAERLRLEDYFSADRSTPDALYAGEAAVIEGYEFDRVGFRVAGSTYRQVDLAHWLALDVATRALADAGFSAGEGLPRETTGVVVGNTLTGEFSRANALRLRWPFVRRTIESAFERENLPDAQREALLERIEATYKDPFPAVDTETLAGGLSNTIAGRICNHYDLKGGGYTVDGACAASLLAVATACRSLETGDIDVAIAGGVDLSLDPFELVGFAKVGALAHDEMRVYDVDSQGFWPGEGCGFVVLMRREDALAQCHRIYATIRGWGVSSDGSGGITRPEAEGQILALRRAYQHAGFGIDTVAYFEGHGTGTAVGDATELEVLTRARREASPHAPSAAIGSVKANLGHTKAAAGVAGLLKTTLALHHRILPPMTGCDRPHASFTGEDAALRVLDRPEQWAEDRVLRAGVSAMGFGGINTHLVLEAETRSQADARTAIPPVSWQDAELFLLAAPDAQGLLAEVRRLSGHAARLSRAELTDLAAALARMPTSSRCRAALVARTPAELAEGLATLTGWLEAGEEERLDVERGVFLGSRTQAPRIGFLFSGQASPVYLSGGAMARRFDEVRKLYDQAQLPAAGDTRTTGVAQPSIVTASLAALEVLGRMGIEAGAGVGHSLGEITLLRWAGVLDSEAVIRIAKTRGAAMMAIEGPRGGMLGIMASANEVAPLLHETSVVIAGLNSPRQTVVSGSDAALTTVAARAAARGLQTLRLPVSHPFHSPLMAAAEAALAAQLAREAFHTPTREILSTVAGGPLAADEDLRALLCRQLTAPVRFMDAVRSMGEVDLLIEVGPGVVLSEMARKLVAAPVVATDAGGRSLVGVLRAAGAAYALGASVRRDALTADRFTRPFDLDWHPRFFVNPCETVPASNATPIAARTTSPSEVPGSAVELSPSTEDALSLLRHLVAERVELPMASVQPESRLLVDLHLNSITVAQIVLTAAKRLGLRPSVAPTEYADATVAEIALALEERRATGAGGEDPDRIPEGVDSWIRPFTVEWVERAATVSEARAPEGQGDWVVLAPADYPLHEALEAALAGEGGSGVMVCLPPEPDERHLGILLAGAKRALADGSQRFVLVQHGGGGGGFARTLHLESPKTTCRIVDVPLDHPRAIEWIVAEAGAGFGCSEVRYDGEGRRSEPILRPLPLEDETPLPLGPGDVLLVTGGGKGIAAESALGLARASGCRLAILGRSDPSADTELARNLARLTDAGIEHHYIAADVTDREAVRLGVRAAEHALGPVTAILHGAGVNEPQLLRTLDEGAAARTVAAKVHGARNVLEAVDLKQVRLFVAFGSIIARTGMRGEADYALANEWLTLLTERLQTQCPWMRCLSLEWSVWSGVGMGERLGRMDALVDMGVSPIAPDQGIAILKRLISSRDRRTSLVVSGRFGALPTLAMETRELPLMRFLERPRVHFPGIELVTDCELSVQNDPYLEDHVFAGEILFPAVMGLEAMAQVAMAVTASTEMPEFEDVLFSRPVVLDRESTTIRIAALVRSPDSVDVVLRCQDTGFKVDHFRCRCRFGLPLRAFAKKALDTGLNASANGRNGHTKSAGQLSETTILPIDPETDLYGGLLFHTGRFKRLHAYRLLRATECVAEIRPGHDSKWFGRYLPQELVLGDPAARDSAIHAVQACIPHATVLPVAIERLTLDPRSPGDIRSVHARELAREGDTLIYDLEILDAGGTVCERWSGLRLRIVGDAPAPEAWPEALLAPYLERRVAELIPGAQVRVAVERDGTRDRRARSDTALGRIARSRVRRRPDGKPEVDAGAVSAGHAGEVTLAVAGEGPIGCDVEPVVARDVATWAGLLGSERATLARQVAGDASEAYDDAATRVWAAAECLKKAGVAPGAPLVLDGTFPAGWVRLAAGHLFVATLATRMRGTEGRTILAVLAEARRNACEPMNTGTSSGSKTPISSATSTT